jgi:hypothetical protein
LSRRDRARYLDCVRLTRLEGKQRELFSIGVAGVIGVGFGLYALVFPAIGLLELLDSQPSDLVSTAIGAVVVFVATAVIAAELVLSAAAIRMTFVGYWPGRRFVLGPPAAAIGSVAYALAAMLAVLL